MTEENYEDKPTVKRRRKRATRILSGDIRVALKMRGFSIIPGEREWTEKQDGENRRIRVVSLTEEHFEDYDSLEEHDENSNSRSDYQYFIEKREK